MDFLEDFTADAEFRKLLGRQDDRVNLTAVALELARDAYPELDFAPVFRWIDDRAAELSGPLARAGSDEALLGELSTSLAGRHGIVGSAGAYEQADGSFLNCVIQKKTGLPISLAVLYMEVAERAGISLKGVASPGHFLASYETIDKPLFLDAYHAGKIMTYDEAVDWLVETQGVARDKTRAALEQVGPRQIVIRMLNNLKTLYAKQGEWRACWKVQHRLLALSPAAYNERRDWAIISIRAGHSGQAIEMLESCLATCPPDEREFLEKQRHEAHGKLAQWN